MYEDSLDKAIISLKRKNLESTTSKENLLTDGEYGWAKKYGETKEIAFQKEI